MDRREKAELFRRKDDVTDDGLLKNGEEDNTTPPSPTSPGLESRVNSLFDAVQRIQQTVMTLLTKNKAGQRESGKKIDRVARRTSPQEL